MVGNCSKVVNLWGVLYPIFCLIDHIYLFPDKDKLATCSLFIVYPIIDHKVLIDGGLPAV